MGSHSVICHPTKVRISPLPSAEAGTRFSYHGGMQGRVDLCHVKADRLGIESATCQSQVQRPTAEPLRITARLRRLVLGWGSGVAPPPLTVRNLFLLLLLLLLLLWGHSLITSRLREEAGGPTTVAVCDREGKGLVDAYVRMGKN